MIKIHNVMTNIVGRTKTERVVKRDVYQKEILPLVKSVLKDSAPSYKAAIGLWTVELIGNDEHMHEFFVKNWKTAAADAKTDVTCYVINHLNDRATMMKLLGLADDIALHQHRDAFVKALDDKKFRNSLRDPRLSQILDYPEIEQLEIALFAPATIYSPDEHVFISINTNYYGQLKSKSSLGPLEELLTRRAQMTAEGAIKNPNEVWISMHAGCVEYVTDKKERRGIVIIAPTGTGKSTHGYGLVEAKKENRLHSDDWVFVNLGSREVLISENRYYMRTNIAEIYPRLIPLLVNQPLENVAFTPDMIELLEGFESQDDLRKALEDGRIGPAQYQQIVEQMVENNSARSLIDPRLMVGEEKFVEKAALTDLLLMKRDYEATFLIRKISAAELVDIMTSKGNVFNYTYGKLDADGYGIPQNCTTEIYYNPYLCVCEVDRDAGRIGALDRVRIEAYRMLASYPEVRATWGNTRLPAAQFQLCLRIYMEGGIDLFEVAKGENVPADLITALGLKKRPKLSAPGRRAIDFTGFFDNEGHEVEIVVWGSEAVAFLKSHPAKKPANAVLGYARRDKTWKSAKVTEFFSRYRTLDAENLTRL